MPLQGASLIALYPGRCLGLRASAPSGRAAYMGFCPFRALLLIWAFGLSGRAAYMGFCPFRACSLYGLLPLQGIAAYMGCLDFRAMLLWVFGRCCLYGLLALQGVAVPCKFRRIFRAVWLKLPCMPFCTVEITLHTLLYG